MSIELIAALSCAAGFVAGYIMATKNAKQKADKAQ